MKVKGNEATLEGVAFLALDRRTNTISFQLFLERYNSTQPMLSREIPISPMPSTPRIRSTSLLLASVLLSACAFAQTKPQPQPQPVPMPPPIVTPVDKPYIGPIKLTVDLRNNVDRVETVQEEIPVVPGAREMVLLYPEWLPGDHEPSGPIANLAGIVTRVDGKRVQWVRDRVHVYAFHVPLPANAKTVELDFDYLSPIKPSAGR
ncbi:MAG: hypothetical protein ABI076_07225, partial [Acidobacteriaceae bacterium]